MVTRTFAASTMALTLAHLSAAIEVTQPDTIWVDGEAIPMITIHPDVCDYSSDDEVCVKWGGYTYDIQPGMRIMSRREVWNNALPCISAMGEWDIISLRDGKVDGAGYGYEFHEHSEVECGQWRWMFLMSDSECEGTGLDC